MNRLTAALLLVLPGLSFAAIGKIVVIDGSATRTAEGGKPEELKLDSPIEIKDTLKVGKGNLKLELNDGSQIMLGEKSELYIDSAQFDGQECKGFLGTLKAGSLWTKVKKLLGGAKYEVKTERAVAGVRGTIFRIDADTVVKAAKGRKASVVRVVQGVVRVNPTEEVIKKSKGATAAAPKGPRTQVAGPQEVSSDEWEKKFVELQAGQQVTVGVDLWDQAELAEAAKNDAFSKWIDKNQ